MHLQTVSTANCAALQMLHIKLLLPNAEGCV
jgi:hypothetical protein